MGIYSPLTADTANKKKEENFKRQLHYHGCGQGVGGGGGGFMSLSRSHEHLIEAKNNNKKNNRRKLKWTLGERKGTKKGKSCVVFFLRFVWLCVSVSRLC